MIKASSVEDARRQISKAGKNKEPVIVQGRDIEFNRKILEIKQVKMLVLNLGEGRDKLKERDSGLNQVLAKIAQENKVTIAIDFNEIREEDQKKKAKILSRLIQNIKLAKKYKFNLEVINKPRDRLSLAALFRTLGASSELSNNISRSQ